MSAYISQIQRKYVSSTYDETKNYWKMNVEEKVWFLYNMIKEFDAWFRIQKVSMPESNRQKEEIQWICNQKIQSIENHLQSYRVEIEKVLDDTEHQKYITIYQYFVFQIEDRAKTCMKYTNTSILQQWLNTWFSS